MNNHDRHPLLAREHEHYHASDEDNKIVIWQQSFLKVS